LPEFIDDAGQGIEHDLGSAGPVIVKQDDVAAGGFVEDALG
jgi:hypothetical protein